MVDKEYIKINLVTGKTFSYLEYHTDSIVKVNNPNVYYSSFSFVKKIEVDNQTDNEYKDLIVHLEFSNDIFSSEDFHIGFTPRRSKYLLKIDPKIKVDERRLYALNGVSSCTIFISLRDPNDSDKELCSNNKTVKILPLNQATNDFYSAPLLFSKYCVTDFKEIIEIQHAANIEKAKLNGNETDCIIGYQNNDTNEVLKELTAIYRAIHNTGNITYSNPPNSNELVQNIRMPNVVLKTKLGTCLDLAILFCSALLQVGYHPLLLIVNGHAFAGCFLHEYDSFNGYYEKNPNVVFSDSVSEDKKIVLFECTTATNSSTVPFSEAMKMATERLRSYRGFFVAVDIYRAQQSLFKPIPIENKDGVIDFTIPVATLRKEEMEEINEYQGTPISDTETQDRFSTWEKKLLDLTSANKLVNFRFAKNGSNHAIVIPPNGKGKDVFEFLKKCDGTFTLTNFASILSDEKGQLDTIEDAFIQKIAIDQMKKGNLVMASSIPTMKSLIKKDSESREETGSPTLYLSIGLLSGYDSNGKSVKEIRAPFLLVPIKVTKNRYGDDFTASYDIEEMMVNKTFFEYYKLKKGTDYDSLYSITSHNRFEDIVATLKENHTGDVELNENVCFIANFLFTHMVMWQDIVDRQDVLRENIIIKSLLDSKSYLYEDKIETKNVDELDTMKDFAAPLPYDSTQLRAIRECAKGNSFILDGPPGTGKSQTIVNMIVNAFYHGKTVLFVAEKQAALEVVRQRLFNLGLDPFALQLYSSKTNKQAFFKQISKVMEYGRKSSDEDFLSVCDKIEKEKKVINEELKRLHSHKKYFYSLYEAITRELATDDIKNNFDISQEFLTRYDAEKDDAIRNIIHHIEKVEGEFDGEENEAYLPIISFTHYTYQDQIDLVSSFTEEKKMLSSLKEKYDSLNQEVKMDTLSLTVENIDFVVSVLDALLNRKPNVESFASTDLDSYYSLLSQALDKVQSLIELEKELSGKYKADGISQVDGEAVRAALSKGTNFLNRSKARKEALRLLSPMLKNELSEKEDIIQASEAADKYNHLEREIRKEEDKLKSFFHTDILKDKENYYHYRTILSDTIALYHSIMNGDHLLFDAIYSIVRGISPFALIKAKDLFLLFKEDYDAFASSLKEIKTRYPLDLTSFGKEDFFSFYSKVFSLFTEEEKHYKISQYTKLLSDYEKLNELGLSDFVSLIRKNEIPLGELERTYEHTLSHAFVVNGFVMDDANNDFDASLYEEEISEYQNLIRKYNSLCVGETIEKITEKFDDPDLKRSATTPIGSLRKLCMNSGKGISIRNTLNRYEDLLRTYFPCFLMSPLAAAQYLDVNSRKFDIVIFDEASQIPTSEAIGPIARGNSLIVAGDPQQMPPSEYFTVSTDLDEDSLDGEAVLLSDAESLLDDCIAIDMPRIRLAFHYRSKHESLIQFSNRNFYGGDLFTFPSTDSLTSHVSFLHVDSITKKKGSDISKEEIDAILNILKQLLDNPKTKNKSLGIIVFNSAQQEKLEEEVDQFLSHNQEYLELTHWAEEVSDKRLFVKNLENVQGDERDIIIMSIGFTKGKDGKALINGPLALAKGERRLNVAASRSVEQMIVVSTIYSGDIDETGKKNQGAKNLKDFLRFAENSERFALDESNDSTNKDLAYFIKRELNKKGYLSDVSVGTSEFKVDLAVRKKDSKEYVLGILLDEKPLNGNISCRDRFFVEPIILKNLKWKVLRVYTVLFLRYKSKTIKQIIEMIETVEKEKTEESALYIPPQLNEHHVSQKDFGIIPYLSYKYEKKISTDIALERGRYYKEMLDYLSGLLDTEYPLSKDQILDKTKTAFNISRLTQKNAYVILSHVQMLSPTKTTDFEDAVFYWPKGKEVRMDHFRSSDRDIKDICKEEILSLMNAIITIYKEISKEELIRVMAEQMNLSAITSKVRRKLEYVIHYGEKNHLLKEGYHGDDYYPMK